MSAPSSMKSSTTANNSMSGGGVIKSEVSIRPLNDSLTVDKIAELRWKRQMRMVAESTIPASTATFENVPVSSGISLSSIPLPSESSRPPLFIHDSLTKDGSMMWNTGNEQLNQSYPLPSTTPVEMIPHQHSRSQPQHDHVYVHTHKTSSKHVHGKYVHESESHKQVERLAERIYRTSENVMLASGSRNFSRIHDILDRVSIREKEDKLKRAMANLQGSTISAAPSRPKSQPLYDQMLEWSGQGGEGGAKRAAGYNRYDQEQFAMDSSMDFLVSRSNLSFAYTLNDSTTRPNTPIPCDNRNAKMDVALIDKKPPLMTSSFVAPSIASSDHEPTDKVVDVNPFAVPCLSNLPPQIHEPLVKKRPIRISRTPIIVVPQAITSLITLFNARDILENMTFVNSEERRAFKSQKGLSVFVNRKKDGNTVQYRIIDDPTRLSNNEDWDRIVGVFVHGPSWQFKGWNLRRWDSNPVKIFDDIKAFHLYFQGEKIDPNVTRWNVTPIGVSRVHRYLDKAHLPEIWKKLEAHIALKYPSLRY